MHGRALHDDGTIVPALGAVENDGTQVARSEHEPTDLEEQIRSPGHAGADGVAARDHRDVEAAGILSPEELWSCAVPSPLPHRVRGRPTRRS